ncbi:MAG: hypothetical protein WCO03_00025 [bacterium]
MSTNTDIAIFLEKQIKIWKDSNNAHLIIGLEGPSGCGKSTITNALKNAKGITLINADKYLLPLNTRLEKLSKTKPVTKTYREYWYDKEALVYTLSQIGDQEIILIEGMFLKWITGEIIDKLVRIEIAPDLLLGYREKKCRKYTYSQLESMGDLYYLCDKAWEDYCAEYKPNMIIETA